MRVIHVIIYGLDLIKNSNFFNKILALQLAFKFWFIYVDLGTEPSLVSAFSNWWSNIKPWSNLLSSSKSLITPRGLLTYFIFSLYLVLDEIQIL